MMSDSYDIRRKKMDFLKELKTLGLNGRQAGVYLELLRLGSATAIELSHNTGYKHPTVYDVLEVLKHRGLISEVLSSGRKVFVAEPPEKLQEDLDERRNALAAMLPSLKEIYSARGQQPVLRYYHGESAFQEIDRQLLNVRNKEYFYFGSIQEIMKITGAKYQEEYTKERVKRGIRSYALRIRSGETDDSFMRSGKKLLREVRYLPMEIEQDFASLYLYDNTVAIVSGLQENYAVTIESRELFRLLKTIWQCVWNLADFSEKRLEKRDS